MEKKYIDRSIIKSLIDKCDLYRVKEIPDEISDELTCGSDEELKLGDDLKTVRIRHQRRLVYRKLEFSDNNSKKEQKRTKRKIHKKWNLRSIN